MTPKARQARISDAVSQRGQMSVDMIVELFGISHETARRDLTALEKAGALVKVHGGARLAQPVEEEPFARRLKVNAAAKRLIASKAATLAKPKDVLFIDTGSTTLLLAEELAKVVDLTVFTNCARIARVIDQSGTGSTAILLPGRFRSGNDQTIGPMTVKAIAALSAKIAFLTVGAVDATFGASDYDVDEAEIASAMVAASERCVLLADRSKFDRKVSYRVTPLNGIHTLVCDQPPEKALHAALMRSETSIM